MEIAEKYNFRLREKKTFGNYRARAVMLLNAYDKFRANFIDSGIMKYVTSYIKNNKKDFEIFSKTQENIKNKIKQGIDEETIKNELYDYILEFSSKHSDYFDKMTVYTEQEKACVEMFLLGEKENANELLGLVYENCDFDFNLLPGFDSDEYYEFLTFLLTTWDFFFLKHRGQKIIAQFAKN